MVINIHYQKFTVMVTDLPDKKLVLSILEPSRGVEVISETQRLSIGRIPGIFDEKVCAGIYFDVVFEDGTTLACISGDGKGTHLGQPGTANGPVSVWAYDPFCEGYAHLRLKSANIDDRSYISVLELRSYSEHAELHFDYRSKRIKEIITYGIQHIPDEKKQYISWTQKCNMT